jgi:hypothetical protein
VNGDGHGGHINEPRYVQKWIGHKNLVTTERYLHDDLGLDISLDLREAK